MKKCFLELVDRFTWESDDDEEDTETSQQSECVRCLDLHKCYQLSIARCMGRVLLQLELINQSTGEDDDGNGDVEVMDVEAPLEED